ncbi:MAG TPA: PilC/PilY family type IV pilus protein, partial [Rubrivivax sp.]|nr:PilC/PilY family type IV pilus protein [Rubrivivax sp.]
DTFRWVLTGGYRVVDTATETIIEKAWASGQGGTSNFANRSLTGSSAVDGATPLGLNNLYMRVQGLGNKLRFSSNSGNVDNANPTEYSSGSANNNTLYEVSVRVRVCDPSLSAGGLESNCTLFPSGNYKPTGLMQQYADQIRYAAFGYLNDSSVSRDGGVLRSKMKFIGPTVPQPGGTTTTNAAAEWDATTGVLVSNPDSADATATATAYGVTVADSGAMNYLNKFGKSGSYKTYDPVGELYYSTLRYFKKQSNVPEYTDMTGWSTAAKTTAIDGFPVITNWDDPVQYACQRNFILGIGDVNTHADRNLPSATGSSEPSKPALVSADTTVNALLASDKVGELHGISNLGATQNYGGCCTNNGALIAGLAYDANTVDIRPDDASDLLRTKGKQTVQTYWMDVLEYSTYKSNNQYYLAAKYGGFTVPDDFVPYTRTGDIPQSWWRTNTDTVGSQPRPDNYFIASEPAQVVTGLTKAFQSIASKLKAYTTSFQTALPQISAAGTGSYSTQFDSKNWTGEVIGSLATVDPASAGPSLSEAWRFSAKLDAQAAGTGWNTGRRIATFNTATNTGVAFRSTSISPAQLTALDTPYRTGNDSADYLNYLRGDRTHEKFSTATGSTQAYRDRSVLLGDVVNAKARAVASPNLPYSTAANPGYGTFKTTWASRPTMVYIGTNGGMLHAVNGTVTTTPAGGGSEVFAYVPGALFNGPTATPGTNGLAAIGNPTFTHYNFVDASPAVGDVDFGRTVGGTGTDWRTIIVGGLGKGGKAIYALDITDPASVTTEAAAVTRVLWEFTDADLGYTFGEPAIVKTRKHGWVVMFGSGYNNANGEGYIYILNPRNGALLEKLATCPLPGSCVSGSGIADAGLAHVQAFVPDRTDGTADSVYAGDMKGRLWRVDLSQATGAYPAPVQLMQLQDANGAPLAVTSRPLIVIQPDTGRRWVTVGTGRLLATSDATSTQSQRFYAFVDGNNARVMRSNELPSGVSWPFDDTRLQQLTDLTQKINVDFTTKMGWYIDLGVTAGSNAWRVINDSTSFYGVVAFPAMQPTTNNPCEPSGTSRVYAVDLGTGQSRLQTEGTTQTPATTIAYSTALPGVVTDLRFYAASGKPVLVGGSDTGATGRIRADLGPTAKLRRLNWREVPLAD